MIQICQVGTRIEALRQERGMTQLQLAEAMGVTRQAVSKWENGLAFPDLSRLDELAALLGTNIECLLLGKGVSTKC